jgi:hypothetical protein
VQGPYTREDGFLGYNEICMENQKDEAPWTNEWEEEHAAPYMFRWLQHHRLLKYLKYVSTPKQNVVIYNSYVCTCDLYGSVRSA